MASSARFDGPTPTGDHLVRVTGGGNNGKQSVATVDTPAAGWKDRNKEACGGSGVSTVGGGPRRGGSVAKAVNGRAGGAEPWASVKEKRRMGIAAIG